MAPFAPKGLIVLFGLSLLFVPMGPKGLYSLSDHSAPKIHFVLKVRFGPKTPFVPKGLCVLRNLLCL
jgi:hypothetical protein